MEAPDDPALNRLRKRAERERQARLEAEAIAERSTRALYEQKRQLLLLQRIAMAANEARSVEEAMQTALDEVCAYTGWPVGHMYLRVPAEDPSGTLVPTRVWHCSRPEAFASFGTLSEQTTFSSGIGLPGRVLATGRPAWVTDIGREPNFPRAGAARAVGIRAAFAFPVLVGKEVVAVLEFFATEVAELQETLLEAMVYVGAQLGRVVERKRSEEVLLRREQQLADARRAHLGSWEWDPAAETLDWSAELYRIYGLDPETETLSYRRFLERVHPEDRAYVERVVAEALASGEPFTFFHRILRPDGSIRILHSRGEVVADREGRPVRMVGTGQDVTEARLAAEKLEAYARRLEQSNRDLQDFAYVASHDLQEPLRKIMTFGDRLRSRYGEGLDEQGRLYLERMRDAAGRMQSFIRDLLALSRISTQTQPLRKVSLGRLIGEVVSDLEAQIEQTGGRVDLEALPSIEADPVQMRQLFQNLISNALKFHRDGVPPVVRLSGRIEPDPQGQGLSGPVCRLLIEDNGIGFEEKYPERIFLPFQRLHGRGEYEGTGMGLAICRKIVERHGGTIAVRSVPGQGSRFVITLPVQSNGGQPG